MNRPFAIVVAALALLPSGAQAQLERPTTPSAVFQLADRQDWLLRVTSTSGAVVEGTVQSVSDDAVDLDGGRVAIASVARIERGDAVGGGGRTGMIAGAVIIGTLFVVISSSLADESEFDAAELGPIAVAGVVAGAILGGLVGADLDPARTEWRQVWPASGW